MRSRVARARAGWLLACTLAWAALAAPAAALAPEDLLPVDEAFVLQARAAADGHAIAVHWRIAEGYYLYRHRTAVTADAGFAAGELQLPPGQPYEDEFFGKVETYRGELAATLPGEPRAATTTLTIKYQGCADAGICYPPQTRNVTVALPAPPPRATGGLLPGTPAAADPLPAASGLAPAWGRVPGATNPAPANAVPAAPGLLGALGNNRHGPLPPELAFGFEAIANDGHTLLLRFTPADGYYLYRDQTTLLVEGGAVTAGAPRWPPGTDHHDEYFGDVVVYFTPVEVPVPLQRQSPEPVTIRLTAGFQGCQTNGICYPPMTRTVDVALPAVDPAALVTGNAATARADAAPADPIPAAPPPTAPAVTDATAAGGTTPPDDTPAGPAGGTSLLFALLLALAGGVILNLMPCVLPVLSLKVLSLAGSGSSPARSRRHALWYTAGVLASFAALGALALGLRHAGLALGWGFQLQQPLVVAVLGLVMFGLGLSLSGVWYLGGRWAGAGHGLASRAGPAGDFFTGVLAVVVATPCTAPFMGAALAWAFTAPAATAMAVFLALGLGLALPFLLAGFVPAVARLLPMPGAWMDTFKQVLAFPLYLTAVWLAWVLARQRGVDAIGLWLLAAVLLAFAAWAWNRSRIGARGWLVAAAVAVLALAWPLRAIHVLAVPAPATALASEAAATGDTLVAVPFSEQRLADLRAAGRPVFVNITADWCVSCKANEKAVLSRDGFRQALADADAVYMRGDWTNVDPVLTGFLQRHRSYGVPLYVVYPRGGGEGEVLPTLLTGEIVREALARAAGAAP